MTASKWKEILHKTASDYNTEPVFYMRELPENKDGERELWDFEVKFKEFEMYAVWWGDKGEGKGTSIQIGLGDMLQALKAAISDK